MVKRQLRFSPSALRLLELNHNLVIAQPEIGCLVVWDHGHGFGHVGLIEVIDGDDVQVIAGNTNDDGTREGYKVCRRQYHLDDPQLTGFVRVA